MASGKRQQSCLNPFLTLSTVWRPQRDLNSCYRRESRVQSAAIAAKHGYSLVSAAGKNPPTRGHGQLVSSLPDAARADRYLAAMLASRAVAIAVLDFGVGGR